MSQERRGRDAIAPDRTPALELHGVSVAYDGTRVLDGLDLSVSPGETLVLLGPSGSGKTTLLYAVAGFVPLAAGELRIAGIAVASRSRSLPPERRDVAFVFQHYALWPHLTALETVAYPLRRRGMGAAEARTRAAALLELMGVGHLAVRRPAHLSGGEQQRVGVARALAREAGLVLLDEPTAHLDAPLRAALTVELAEQRRRLGAAAVYATHDVTEALAVADRVALLRDGRLVQVGTPRQIYEEPIDLWAARLSGPASVIAAELGGDGVVLVEGQPVSVVLGGPAGSGAIGQAEMPAGQARLLVRPDWATLDGTLPARVTSAWFRGPHTDYRLETPSGDRVELREPGPPRIEPGASVTWTLRRAWRLPA